MGGGRLGVQGWRQVEDGADATEAALQRLELRSAASPIRYLNSKACGGNTHHNTHGLRGMHGTHRVSTLCV